MNWQIPSLYLLAILNFGGFVLMGSFQWMVHKLQSEDDKNPAVRLMSQFLGLVSTLLAVSSLFLFSIAASLT
jgi:hypothetical protein